MKLVYYSLCGENVTFTLAQLLLFTCYLEVELTPSTSTRRLTLFESKARFIEKLYIDQDKRVKRMNRTSVRNKMLFQVYPEKNKYIS